MFLSKEASNNDERLKMEMMVASMGESPEESTERVWKKNGFFGDQRADLTIKKANFSQNTLVYVNNGSVIPVKVGHAIYLEYVILTQICLWQTRHLKLTLIVINIWIMKF